MSQPDQYPSSQPQQAPNGANAAPVDSSGPAAGTQGANQPSYGQYLRPAYGAMDNQFPQDYDPYIFGRPDPEPQPAQASQAGPTPAVPQLNQAPTQPWAGQQAQAPQAPGATQQGGKYPRYVNGIDMEDPNQNIFYGRWDAGAIIAFVFALFLPVPIMPAILGALSMRRTRIMRMKGYGLALAAVIINVLYTIAFVWLMINGVSMDDVMNQMLQSLNSSTSGGSGDSVQA
ncbi:hypothetical protein PG2089B_0801 [Bifidobacterium pseudolongum subsp. globosum]|nr:hypothetical protein PG2115B_0812 [Bifidobacterium pseudolongum subsp. globosum]RYQ07031.1 hypothetical protein PG2114B_0804 [Bifidobacterium pseudolongum subsp. globosum]RYQ13826.1 hypothetical protein PG2089B_0801 [Bifidobacterium pseudolongum subsp. globosum]RYQ66774.1 hypothetical protein PG2109B_0817 [Bifidobacterium pseudolongum subsp. globosum]